MGKRLGQHFLKNSSKLRKIADSLDLKKGDFVVEIGPGNGELTKELIKYPIKVVAIEKDQGLYEKLVNSNWKLENVEFINSDALKTLLPIVKNQLPTAFTTCNLQPTTFKVVGNIPYYITGYLLRVIGDLITNCQSPVTVVVLTVQKEVAERICAEPPKMNLLAASVQFWASPEIIDYIPKKDFRPQPKIDSAIVRLTPKQKLVNGNWKLENDGSSSYQLLATNYYKIVKILFKQPRKTILNNLTDGLKLNKDYVAEKLKELKVNPLDRPQNLNVKDILEISCKLETEGAWCARIYREKHQENIEDKGY